MQARELLAWVFLLYSRRQSYTYAGVFLPKKESAKLISGEATAVFWTTVMAAAAGSCYAQRLFGSIAHWPPGVTLCWGQNLFLLCLLEMENGIKQKEDWVKYIQPNSAVLKLNV